MKKSKVTFISGVLVLAAASGLSAKLERAPSTLYYSTGAGCTTIEVPFDCHPGGTGCVTIIGDSVVQLYLTTDENGDCSTPLRVEE